MKILENVVEFLSLKLRLDKKQSFEEHYPINHRSMSALVIFSLSTISCGIHLFFKANNFAEYTYSIAALSSMLIALAVFVILFFEICDFSVGLDDLADTITKSKLCV